MEVDHALLAFQILELSLAKSLGENISGWVLGPDMPKNEETRHKFFADKVAINLDVLSPLMEDRIFCNM